MHDKANIIIYIFKALTILKQYTMHLNTLNIKMLPELNIITFIQWSHFKPPAVIPRIN